MDYVLDTNQLLVGTGSGTVLTQNIVEFLSYHDYNNDMALVEMDGEYGQEGHGEQDEYAMDMEEVDAEIQRILGKGQDGMSHMDRIRVEQLEILRRDRMGQ